MKLMEPKLPVQLLRGQALNWVQAVLRTYPEITYQDFLVKFKSVFEKGTRAETAAHRLLNIKQGKSSMAEYSVEFWTLAEETGWGQSALMITLLNNVCDELKNELMMRDVLKTLSDVITLCEGRRAPMSTSGNWKLHYPEASGTHGDGSCSRSPPRLMIAAKLTVQLKTHSLRALIDSGAEQNFIDALLVLKLNFSMEPLPHSLQVTELSG